MWCAYSIIFYHIWHLIIWNKNIQTYPNHFWDAAITLWTTRQVLFPQGWPLLHSQRSKRRWSIAACADVKIVRLMTLSIKALKINTFWVLNFSLVSPQDSGSTEDNVSHLNRCQMVQTINTTHWIWLHISRPHERFENHPVACLQFLAQLQGFSPNGPGFARKDSQH